MLLKNAVGRFHVTTKGGAEFETELKVIMACLVVETFLENWKNVFQIFEIVLNLENSL